ncbi:MAG: O-antigen/teichoic acid export membrane protein [Candidatus Azotimanducaceae bacterium]|jgi:O-antigen/teichoic acid export membrane protein
MINKMVKNTFAVLSNSLLTSFLGFLLVPILLASVGTEKYGLIVLTVFFSVRNGVLGIFICGIQSAMTKFVAEFTASHEDRKISVLLNSALVFYFLISSLIVLFLYSFKVYLLQTVFNVPLEFLDDYLGAFDFVIAAVYFQFFNLVLLGYLEGLQQFMTSKLIDTSSYLLYFLSVLALLHFGYGYVEVIKALSLMHVVTFLVSLLVFNFKNGKYSFTLSHERSTQLRFLRYCGALFSGGIAGVLYNQSPKFFVTTILTPAALGIYDIVSKVPNLAKTIIGFGNAVVVPVASELSTTRGAGSTDRLFIVGLKLNLLIFVPFITCLVLLTNNIIEIWVGIDYVQYGYLMQFLFLVPLLSLFISHGNSIFLGINYRMGLFSSFGWIIFSISTLYILATVDQFGLFAIASSRSVGLLVIVPVSVAIFLAYFKIPTLPFLARMLCLAILGVVPYSVAVLIGPIFSDSSLLGLVVEGGVEYLSYALFIYLVVLDSTEKHYVGRVVALISQSVGLGTRT